MSPKRSLTSDGQIPPSAPEAEPGRYYLREHKKRQTHRRLIDISQRLFVRNGYEATTLDQIAIEAEVSIRTLLRYFNSKERLAMAWHHDALDYFRESIKQTDLPTLQFWRQFSQRYAVFFSHTNGALEHRQLLETVPALLSHWLWILREYEDLLTESLCREGGTDPSTDLHSRLVAIALMGGNEAVTRRWASSRGTLDLGSLVMEVVDTVEKYLFPTSTDAARS